MSLPSESQSLSANQISSRYLHWRLRYYFRFRNTNVRHIGMLLLISYRPVRRNLHVILHQATEFRPNRSTYCENMTSYLFLKMAAATAIYYFRFRIFWCHCLQKVKVYQQTKFRPNTSIGGWDMTIFGFEIQTFAILEFYFRFRSRPLRRNRRVILQPSAECRLNRNIRRWNMTSYQFSRWRPSAMLYLLWGNADHPRSAFLDLNSVLKSLVRRSSEW